MGRICTGYRDPVDTMFRDESNGFGTKRQRATKSKKAPTTAPHKSSWEIDQAFTACSFAFVNTPTSIPSQTCESPLPTESDLPNEEPSLFFGDDVLSQHKFYGVKDPKVDTYGGEIRDALMESLLSLGSIVELPNSWNTDDTTVDAHTKYNTAFIDSLCRDGEARDEFAAIDLDQGFSNDSENSDCPEMDDMFDFDCFDSRLTSNALPLHTQEPCYDNKLALAFLPESSDMQALCYFFSNYVLEDTSVSEGYLNYLPNLCMNEDGRSFLMDTVTSLGLVGLAMKKHDRNALNNAQLKYASALRELNVALTSSDGALTDQALTTVFLMGLYEVCCPSTVTSLYSLI